MRNKRSPNLRSRRARIEGATLIEVLVALLILSFGLLGMAGLQARAVKGNHSAMQRTQAVMMSYYILDAMRVDADSAKLLSYNTGAISAGVIAEKCDPDFFDGSTLAQHNLKHWLQSLKANIGTAGDTTTCGAVLCDASGQCHIQVRWDDTRAGGLGVQIIDTRTKL